MAYSHDLHCATCHKPGVRMEVIGRFNYSEGLFCAPCGKQRLKKLVEIESENIKLERARPELIGKLR